jgi:hypothetical protein
MTDFGIYPQQRCPDCGGILTPHHRKMHEPVSTPVPEPSIKTIRFSGKPLVLKPPNAELPQQPQRDTPTHSVISAPRAIIRLRHTLDLRRLKRSGFRASLSWFRNRERLSNRNRNRITVCQSATAHFVKDSPQTSNRAKSGLMCGGQGFRHTQTILGRRLAQYRPEDCAPRWWGCVLLPPPP